MIEQLSCSHSEMAVKILGHNWTATPVGDMANWPSSLRTAVSIMLEAKIPMYIAWGNSFTQFYNDTYLTILGAKGNTALGNSSYETWNEIWHIIGPMFKSVMQGESLGFPGFNLFLERKGYLEEAYFDFSYSPIRNEDGSVGGVFLSCIETTDRVLNERRMATLANIAGNVVEPGHNDVLVSSHQKLAADIKDIPFSLLYLYNPETHIYNLASYFGIGNADVVPANLLPRLTNEQIGRLMGQKNVVLAPSAFFAGQTNYTNKSWEEDPRQMCLSPLTSAGASRPNLIIAYGVSPRLQLDDDYTRFHNLCSKYILNSYSLKQTLTHERIRVEAMQELLTQKDEFISVASHELKTPLTSIKAYMQVIERSMDPQQKVFQFIKKASQQFNKLQGLISDLLDVSKINAGKLVYNFTEFDFADVVKESWDVVELISDKHTIVIEQNDSVVFRGDKLRLEQVINNFLTNAIKYSDGSKPIIIRSLVDQDNIIVSIQDFGIGIAPENMARLFDRFYRVDNTSMQYQGLGLGLYIASTIIKAHNGSFWVESQPSYGSTFNFLLPINGKQELRDIETDNQTYYIGNYITITYNAEKQWLEADWLGYQNLESVKKGCLIMLDLLKKNKCSKVLNDNTHVKGNWSEASDWGSEFWFPAMQNAGLKEFAWIYSPSTFSRLAAHKSVDIFFDRIKARFFTKKQEAIAWLSGIKE